MKLPIRKFDSRLCLCDCTRSRNVKKTSLLGIRIESESGSGHESEVYFLCIAWLAGSLAGGVMGRDLYVSASMRKHEI